MRRNFFLFGILLFFLIFTYFFEELGQVKRKQIADESNRLFDAQKLGLMHGFSLMDGSEIYYKNNNFYTKKLNYPVSPEEMKVFFDILSSIKIQRYLDNKEVDKKNITLFIPDLSRRIIFKFEKGQIEFTLGKKMQTDPSFYMMVKTDVNEFLVVAYDDSPLEGIYHQDEAHQNSEKYNRLVRAFFMTENDFLDRSIIKNQTLEDLAQRLQEIRVENLRNIHFSVNTKDRTTNPEAMKGLDFNKDYYLFFLGALANMKALNIWLPEKNIETGDLIAHMILTLDKKIEMRLYKKYGKKNGFFIKTNLEDVVFEVDQNIVRLFFANVQDFWDKRILSDKFNHDKRSFDFSLVFDREYAFMVNQGTQFDVVSKDLNSKPKNSGFKELFDFLAREADFVKKRLDGKGEILFSFAFSSSTFHVIFKEGDLIISDSRNDLDYYYHVGDLSRFKYKKSDFIND